MRHTVLSVCICICTQLAHSEDKNIVNINSDVQQTDGYSTVVLSAPGLKWNRDGMGGVRYKS